ncbi:hypothetical protein FB451DRAFT_1162799 [Mycena latifolia]|nr:hypothetical protein FB451DRAFT_1162799 [Mycena latifolia]
MASPPPPQMVLGPYYFGVVVNVFLYGVNARHSVKMATDAGEFLGGHLLSGVQEVFYLFFVETVNTGMCVAMIYEPLIAQFVLAGQPFMEVGKTFNRLVSALIQFFGLQIAISTPVQFFYAWRISVILQSYIASILICLASVGAIAADLMITVSLITSLSRRKTGIKSTDDAVNRIVRNTLQTGAITGAFAVLDIVLFLALPNSTLGSGGQAHGTTMGDQSQRNVLFTESTTGQGSNSTAVVFNKPYARTEFIEMNSDMLDMPYNEPK